MADLAELETRVQAVVKKAMPAVVGVQLPGGMGSGVVVSPDGLVLTAGARVAGERAERGRWCFPDGKRARGKTLGADHTTDAGMIQIVDPGPWPHVPLTRSADAQRGQWVVALGHPGGYRRDRPPVVRLGRVLMRHEIGMLTDCTLVGGDSGGALLDLDGSVIAIHSRIGERTFENVHVPVDSFRNVWNRLFDGEVWGQQRPTTQRMPNRRR